MIVVFAIVNASCAVRCGGAVVSWKLPMTWLRCEMLVLPPGPACDILAFDRKATILWSSCDGDRDHSQSRRHPEVTFPGRVRRANASRMALYANPATIPTHDVDMSGAETRSKPGSGRPRAYSMYEWYFVQT